MVRRERENKEISQINSHLRVSNGAFKIAEGSKERMMVRRERKKWRNLSRLIHIYAFRTDADEY